MTLGASVRASDSLPVPCHAPEVRAFLTSPLPLDDCFEPGCETKSYRHSCDVKEGTLLDLDAMEIEIARLKKKAGLADKKVGRKARADGRVPTADKLAAWLP
jgi:hypothetical protein